MLSKLFACIALIVIAAPLGAAPIITNGSFETPVIGSSWAIVNALDGWTLVNGEVEIWRGLAPSAEGSQHLELDGNSPVAIEQTVATIPGAIYLLRFAFSPRGGTAENALSVYWGEELISFVTASGTELPADSTEWTYYETSLMATSASTTLRFEGSGPSDGLGDHLDDVSLSLTAVPEPSNFFVALAGVGLLALGILRRKS